MDLPIERIAVGVTAPKLQAIAPDLLEPRKRSESIELLGTSRL
jgi:hypothetical protein